MSRKRRNPDTCQSFVTADRKAIESNQWGQAPLLRKIVRMPRSQDSAQILAKFLPQLKKTQTKILGRVLAYLDHAKYAEQNPWLADDYKIAYSTVLNLQREDLRPWTLAFCEYFGKHPRKLIPIFVERERQRLTVGKLDLDFEQEKKRVELPPKKPPQSTRTAKVRDRKSSGSAA